MRFLSCLQFAFTSVSILFPTLTLGWLSRAAGGVVAA
jgi:hypothetical protein